MTPDQPTPDVAVKKRAPASPRSKPDLVLELGRSYFFRVNGSGEGKIFTPIEDPDRVINHCYMSKKLLDAVQPSRPSTLKLKLHEGKSGPALTLPTGLTIVMGKSGSGKTALTLGRLAANNESVTYVRYAEPLDDAMFVTRLTNQRVYSATSEPDVIEYLLNHLFSEPDTTDVFVLDSIRYLVFAPGGATGKGGVNMTLFTQLTHLDIVASLLGKSVVVVVNPLSDDQASYDLMIESALGSCSAVVDVLNPTSIRSNSRASGRRWESVQLGKLTQQTPSEEGYVSLMAGALDLNISAIAR